MVMTKERQLSSTSAICATEKLKSSLIKQALKLLPANFDKNEKKLIEKYISLHYSNVPYEELSEDDENFILGSALSLLQFANEREEEEIKLKVYNPDIEENGWKSKHTIIEIVNKDRPFLVDSLTSALALNGYDVHLIVHPIVLVERDKKNKIAQFMDEVSPNAKKESFIHIQIDRQSSPEALKKLHQQMHNVLDKVRLATTDWPDMLQKCSETVDILKKNQKKFPPEAFFEAGEFLKWAMDNHFTFLGYREYDFKTVKGKVNISIREGSGLGVLQDESLQVFEGRRNDELAKDIQDFIINGELLFITKTNRRSDVHRPAQMDGILIKRINDKGEIIGERLFVGLFTSTAYSCSPWKIPFVRQKVTNTMTVAGFDTKSHAGKALQHILQTYPRDELFQIQEHDLEAIALGILNLQERHRVALFVRHDIFERFVSCLVYVPRDRYNASMRKRVEDVLEVAFSGQTISFTPEIVTDSTLARVHFIIKTTPGQIPDYNHSLIEAKVIEGARDWDDHFREILLEEHGEENGLKLFKSYEEVFPRPYVERFQPVMAAVDVKHIERIKYCQPTEAEIKQELAPELSMNLYKPFEASQQIWRFKIYHPGEQIALSNILPMLENMGVEVIDEIPFVLDFRTGEKVWIHDFGLKFPVINGVDTAKFKESFQECFEQLWHNHIENDAFNQLVLSAGISWRDVVMVRAYAKYLRQAGIQFSQEYMHETLVKNADIICMIVELFYEFFDPNKKRKNIVKDSPLIEKINKALDQVVSLDEDRILRRFVNLIMCTFRTNFFQPAADGTEKEYISFKLDSQNISELPLPRPNVEVFVYSPKVEAIHLRGGKVARGGLRWSDRREDFRTEVLGLMKAQMVKNSVIVPVGSKGGFVVKHVSPNASREKFLEEGVECYKTFIRGLFDITDNFQKKDLIRPSNVICYDEPDPYLVVAADKGTATFSDIANSVSIDYGFWLGDAFASGGSSGYDHKAMGITARGAWESVKRHFRCLGKDIQSEDFSVIGIGDMSGDVFGNGMLLSEHICLKAAFNHRHIFIDPKPNSKKSFVERKRLFETPRTSWEDYDPKLISKGGGVFDRTAKSIELTKEIKETFGIKEDQLTPDELIRKILVSEIDLLWFGGIGTYIKSEDENHAEVGDRANDQLRVNGSELNCKAIGEGANLGVTQLARIEFALNGGFINTDAIDNSAGVDCSDHEVNIKILLDKVVDNGDLTLKQRNELLEDMTDNVAELVLDNNYMQTQVISQSMRHPDSFDQLNFLMKELESENILNRSIEFLPNDEDLMERRERQQVFTSPEISVLLAYAKNTAFKETMTTDLPSDPLVEKMIYDYFPDLMRKKYSDMYCAHRLSKEIIATVFTNHMINRAGPSFIFDIEHRFGVTIDEIGKAYAITHSAFHLEELYNGIRALDNKVPYETQMEMLLDIQKLLEKLTPWVLINLPRPLKTEAIAAEYEKGLAELEKNIDKLLPEKFKRKHVKTYYDRLIKDGVPKDLARRFSILDFMSAGFDIVNIAKQSGSKISIVASLYYEIGKEFAFRWLRTMAAQIPSEVEWEKRAVRSLVEDLYGQQSMFTRKIIEHSPDAKVDNINDVIRNWRSQRAVIFKQFEELIQELQKYKNIDLAMLTVANRSLRNIIIS